MKPFKTDFSINCCSWIKLHVLICNLKKAVCLHISAPGWITVGFVTTSRRWHVTSTIQTLEAHDEHA